MISFKPLPDIRRMKTAFRTALAPFLMTAALAGPTAAADAESDFFRNAAGQWVGPGEIVAGKYKGTKFVCTFTGSAPGEKAGLVMDGGCRVGVFTQKMKATVERDGRGYRGKFQDGAEGKGLDIVSGTVVGPRKMVLAINRAQLRGAMLARLPDANTMSVTVSVKVEQDMVPVIGVSLKRVDNGAVGSVSAD